MRDLTYAARFLLLPLTLVACSSTTRNTASGDDDADSASQTSTESGTDSGGAGGTTTTASGGTDSGDSGGSSSDAGGTAGATSSTTSSGAGGSSGGTSGGGSGGDSAGGSGGDSAGGSGGGSTDSANSTSTTGDSCPDDGSCSNDCPCSTGEGACSNDDECEPGLVCTTAAVAKLGFSAGDKSCMPQHCDNDETDDDLGETSQDCGGDCGCRATYEEIQYEGLSNTIDYVYLLDMSGDGSTLVGNARDEDATPPSLPVVISATDGSVTFLENFGAYGGADLLNDDGSIITGTLNCQDPPDCTDGWGIPFRWAGADSTPVKYPFATGVTGVSSSGNVVTFTEYETDPHRGYRLLVSTGATTYSPALSDTYGVSGNGAVVYGTVIDGGNHGVWHTQNDEVWTPPYPSEWSGGASILGMSADGSVFVGEGRQWIDEANMDYFPFISQDLSFELVEIADDRITDVRPAPRGMSADGARFVASGYNQDTSTRECVFWDEAGGVRTLYTELVSRGLEFPIDVTEIAADAFISDNGRVLIGSGGSNLRPFWRVVLAD